MNRYWFDENNSGGYTVALGVLNDTQPHHVYVDAECVDDAIRAFEEHFGLDWNHENSYEGNSCNCCGRRFSVMCYEGNGSGDYDKYGQVDDFYTEGRPPYQAKTAIPLSECPRKDADNE